MPPKQERRGRIDDDDIVDQYIDLAGNPRANVLVPVPPAAPAAAAGVHVPRRLLDANGRPVRNIRWVVVVHVPQGENPLHFIPNRLPQGVQFMAGQLETGAREEGLHWQLYIEAVDRISMVQLISQMDGRLAQEDAETGGTGINMRRWERHARFDVAYATQQANINYVHKDETYTTLQDEDGNVIHTRFQMGEPRREQAPQQAQRVLAAVQAGATMEQVMMEFPGYYGAHPNGVAAMFRAVTPASEEREVKVHVLWGPTGTGKTYRVHQYYREHPSEELYIKHDRNDIFDGYTGQDGILFDDFSSESQYKITDMLRWLDRYPQQLNVRYTCAAKKWKDVWITSNHHPFEGHGQWWPKATKQHIDAMRRRIPDDCIHHITELPDSLKPRE